VLDGIFIEAGDATDIRSLKNVGGIFLRVPRSQVARAGYSGLCVGYLIKRGCNNVGMSPFQANPDNAHGITLCSNKQVK
jgi:hypothetical protein